MSNATLDYVVSKYQSRFVPGTSRPTEIQGMLRTDLAKDFAELGFRLGVEIGVEKGQFSRYLCKVNPRLTLYSIDPYQIYPGYRDYLSQELLDYFYQVAQQRLAKYRYCHLSRKSSMDALGDFPVNSLDFVYIDGNHEIPWIVDDICWWSTKVRYGGIVAGHDYFVSKRSTRTQIHVKYAVDCCAQSLDVEPYFMVGATSDWETLAKMKERPSWFWVKNSDQLTIWGISS
jgi:hypothetical protein